MSDSNPTDSTAASPDRGSGDASSVTEGPSASPAATGAVRPKRLQPKTIFSLVVIVVVVVLVTVVVVVKVTSASDPAVVGETFQSVSSSDAANVTEIPSSVYNEVGVTSPAAPALAPTPTSTLPKLTYRIRNGQVLPGVFFYGAEFSPYAAAERWVVVAALSRFGNFKTLGQVESSSTVAFSSTPSFTFWKATFSSPFLALSTNEHYSDQNVTGARYAVLQLPSPRQAALVHALTVKPATFPLVDVGNRFIVAGQSSYTPTILSGLSFSQIAADLDQPTNPVTQAIVASANLLTATVCQITSQAPAQVCTSKAVVAADRKLNLSPAG